MSILRRDDVGVDGGLGFGEEAAERSELGIGGVGIGAVLSDFGGGFDSDGTAIADGEERAWLVEFEIGKWKRA